MEHFFSIYKYLEDKRTEIAGWGNANAARQIIVEGQKRWK
ncbi:MAG TPA: inorganic diphosphatase [Candidatus Angelobacter sp.]|nr:inorganic diphosphatase [Candidatus Angelobacter sp.]